jgi:hypothetical protein
MKTRPGRNCIALFGLILVGMNMRAIADEPSPVADNLQRDRLVAWCIVPFDAKQRNPEQRAKMVRGLGMTRIAYDWRENHVASFEEEILQYKKHGIEFFAFWSWHDAMEPLIKKHGIHPQIWIMFGDPDAATQDEKVKLAATTLLVHVERTRRLGLKLGLYNHGGWSGEPSNMVAVCEYLKRHHKADNVGIVYNLHHGHDHIQNFAEQLALMKPWLLCLNLNGMNDNAMPKILPLSEGKHDVALLKIVQKSGYQGPIGIIDHREELDAEESLRLNLDGLDRLLGR